MLRYAPKQLVVCLGALLSLGAWPAEAVIYSLTDLGDLPGGSDQSQGTGINNSGQVSGIGQAAVGRHGFLWESGSGLTDIGAFLASPSDSLANGINSAGTIVGHSQMSGERAFIWQDGIGLTDLGELPGGPTRSFGYGINDFGQAVGYSFVAAATTHAFLWESGVGMTDLGTLAGETNSEAFAINNSGQVVGNSGERPFLWQSGLGMTDLGGLAGGGGRGGALDISNAGHAVGYSFTSDSTYHAFLWQDGSGMLDLGDLPVGIGLSKADAVNDVGQVVGNSQTGGPFPHAFVWQSDTGILDLNDLLGPGGAGWIVYGARGINDAGQIAGTGFNFATGQRHAILLTPVPEAGRLLLVAASVAFGVTIWTVRSGPFQRRQSTKTLSFPMLRCRGAPSGRPVRGTFAG